jgi:predicted DNA binding CopG/RHH family protein
LSKSNNRRTKDKQLIEFERADLGDDIRASRSGRILRRSVKPTSILLEQDLIERLREKGAKRGLGYQTMLKVIVREHLDDY